MHTKVTRSLIGICGLIAALAAAPLAAAAPQPFAVTTTIDSRVTLPSHIRWIAHPKLPAKQVLEVDFVIDGKIRWSETQPPFVYGGDDEDGQYPGYLVTTFLGAGMHRFGVRVTDGDGRVATHTIKARVVAAPEPPAALAGTWARTVSNADLTKSDPHWGGPPPIGDWRLVFDKVGIWELDSTGSGIVNEYAVKGTALDVFAPIQQAPIVEDHIAVTRYGAHNIGGVDCTWSGPFGSYSWSVSGSTLTLTATNELCGQRRGVLEGTWTKVA